MYALGLTKVHTRDLKKALAGLYKGSLAPPLAIESLTRHGLQHCADHLLAHTRTLDKAGMMAVITAVIAERRHRQGEAD